LVWPRNGYLVGLAGLRRGLAICSATLGLALIDAQARRTGRRRLSQLFIG
jgi:hypothetical protein